MMRRLAMVAIGVLALPASSWATPVTPWNYDLLQAGIETCGTCALVGSLGDLFDTASPPPPTVGSLSTFVYYDSSSGIYTYKHLVDPTVDDVRAFTTANGGAGGFD